MQIRKQNGKEYILCAFRRRFVRLTPEEWVRQQVLQVLVDVYGYPKGLMAVEVPLCIGEVKKRCDAVVYNRAMQPLLLVEFKAETVALTQTVLDQACVYNRQLHVPYLMLSNGKQTIVAHIEDNSITFINSIPTWIQLSS